jgi:hypothetical protein
MPEEVQGDVINLNEYFVLMYQIGKHEYNQRIDYYLPNLRS